MKWYCKLVGHTYVYRVENPRISWNTGKDQAELHMTAEERELRVWLECVRCGAVIEDPTREQVKKAGCNVRSA